MIRPAHVLGHDIGWRRFGVIRHGRAGHLRPLDTFGHLIANHLDRLCLTQGLLRCLSRSFTRFCAGYYRRRRRHSSNGIPGRCGRFRLGQWLDRLDLVVGIAADQVAARAHFGPPIGEPAHDHSWLGNLHAAVLVLDDPGVLHDVGGNALPHRLKFGLRFLVQFVGWRRIRARRGLCAGRSGGRGRHRRHRGNRGHEPVVQHIDQHIARHIVPDLHSGRAIFTANGNVFPALRIGLFLRDPLDHALFDRRKRPLVHCRQRQRRGQHDDQRCAHAHRQRTAIEPAQQRPARHRHHDPRHRHGSTPPQQVGKIAQLHHQPAHGDQQEIAQPQRHR